MNVADLTTSNPADPRTRSGGVIRIMRSWINRLIGASERTTTATAPALPPLDILGNGPAPTTRCRNNDLASPLPSAAPHSPLPSVTAVASTAATPAVTVEPNTVYLDTETTGLFGDIRIVELAIVDDAGNVLIDTLVDPLLPIPAGATAVHGIDDVAVAGKPTLDELMPRVHAAIRGKTVVIYNAAYDQKLFPGRLGEANSVQCALRRFKLLAIAGGSGNGTLIRAAAWANHAWTGAQHRALADALAARSVWRMLEAREVLVGRIATQPSARGS